MKKIAISLVVAGLAFNLQGCIFVAGAAAGGAAIAYVRDHRPINDSIQDVNTANKIVAKIHRSAVLKNDCHIEVTVFNKVVLLTGQAPNPQWKQQAEDITRSIPDVGRIYNQITIQGPTSSLTRTSDAWVTTKIRSQMLAEEDLKNSSIKVVTEDGTVYLMGIVKREQADVAVDIARQVDGVQKVIKIFQYSN